MSTHYSLSTIENSRRGMTLLLVLALMVMFAMLIAAFMMTTSQARRTAETTARILVNPVRNTSSNDFLDEAIQWLLTGSADDDIDLSILGNLYGSSEGGLEEHFPVAPTQEGLLRITLGNLSEHIRQNVLGNVVTVEYADENDHLCYESTLVYDVRLDEGYVDIVPFKNFDIIKQQDKYKRLLFNTPPFVTPDYTAPDDNNMFLARNILNEKGKLESVIPSFRHSAEENAPCDVDNAGNGLADGMWIDIDLPIQYNEHTQSYYKPLVSFYVIDMDSRINVNTIGNLAQMDTDTDSSTDVRRKGMGMGLAELRPAWLTEEFLTKRYGSDKPGGSKDDDDLLNSLRNNNGINFDAYTKGGMTADWFGTSPMAFGELGNREQPVQQAEISEIPYLMNPYDDNEPDDNKPFNADDLESLLRSVIDGDYNGLPSELRELLGDAYDPNQPTLTRSDLRYNLTTRSSNIPAAAPLYDSVLSLCDGDSTEAAKLWMLLPQEIRCGNKVNLNRLTLRSDCMTSGRNDELLIEKARFAQEIFYLFQVVLFKSMTLDEKTLECLAQWSVNLVDFIDPDDVMTPFIFKKKGLEDGGVFDNAELMGELLAGTLTALPDDGELIWGFEKPEVVLTETFAVHDRKVEKNSNGDFRQLEKYPESSLFVELYRQGNPQRSYQASCLVDTNNKLDLARRTNDRDSGDYIWRLAIGEKTKTTVEHSQWNDGDSDSLKKNALYQLLTPPGSSEAKYPQFYQWSSGTPNAGHYHPDLGSPERFIWFGDEPPPQSIDIEIRRRSFARSSGENAELDINSSLVIASRKVTNFIIDDKSIDLSGKKAVLMTTRLDSAGRRGLDITLNVSEPLPVRRGNALTDAYTPPDYGTPSASTLPYDIGYDNGILRQCGTIPCFKTICLQRLADPNRAHDPISNPYLTVDWNMIDLHVINSLDIKNEENVPDKGLSFVSRQWSKLASNSNLWDRTLPADMLAAEKAGLKDDAESFHSFGDSTYSTPLMHFPWNDAPLMNTGELMLVPSSVPGRFGVEFHDNGKGNNFFGDSPRFGYQGKYPYLDWSGSDRQHLFDFVHVPSLFAGTRWNSSGLLYREPGKMNLHTLTEGGWEALRNGREIFPTYEEFQSRIAESALSDASALDLLLGWKAGNEECVLIDGEAENPYTALENLMRLSDVTTTRSNVFAVWITVGYFNVDPSNNDAFGDELGLDDGTVQRHRAFYLIDRSVPVGFRRGEELNTKDVIIKETRLD